MNIEPNPQWMWKVCKGSEFIRVKLTQKSDGYELEAWKNTFILFDKTVRYEWSSVQPLADAWLAAFLGDGWTRCE